MKLIAAAVYAAVSYFISPDAAVIYRNRFDPAYITSLKAFSYPLLTSSNRALNCSSLPLRRL